MSSETCTVSQLDNFITRAEVATRLGVSPSRVDSLVACGQLQPVITSKLGRLYSIEVVDALDAARKQRAAALQRPTGVQA